MNRQLKEITDSPWLRVVQLLLTSLVGIFLFTIVNAKEELNTDIHKNSTSIESLRNEMKGIEMNQVQNTVILKYIREMLEEIKEDIRDIKQKK
jgi:hypothetical protein